MTVLVVSGTGTGVGKTVVTAALAAVAAAAGASVAVVKPAQTGVLPSEPGDLEEVGRLTGLTDLHEYARYPDPLAPEAAARLRGLPALDLAAAAERIGDLARSHDLVVVEGAGGLLVRYDPGGATIADLARQLGAAVVVVTHPTLGTLNHTTLTVEALAVRRVALAGVVLGSWPREPDLASRCNLRDLETIAGAPLAGALPHGAGSLDVGEFLRAARGGLAPLLGGGFDPAAFRSAHDPAAPEDRP